MDKIKLASGLIAIGFHGEKSNIEKTKFPIYLANKLAENEKVLFLNWNNYSRKLEQILTGLGWHKNPNLQINTSVNYFGLESFFDIIDLIESEDYKTIFIDDIFSFTMGDVQKFEDRDLVIKTLKFISDRFLVIIVFQMNIDDKMFLNSNYVYEVEPELGYFNWSRMIINDCEQVFAIKNLTGIIDDETDEFYQDETYRIYELKNDSDITENYIINLKK